MLSERSHKGFYDFLDTNLASFTELKWTGKQLMHYCDSTNGLEESSDDDVTSIRAFEQYLLVSSHKAEDDYFVCSVCDDEVHNLEQFPLL